MSWRTNINPNGEGQVGSDDYDGVEIQLTARSNVNELIESIDVVIKEGGERNFVRALDGVLVEVAKSQAQPGKIVISRQNGNWIRLTRSEARELRNELLRRIASPNEQRATHEQPRNQNEAFDNYINIMGRLQRQNEDQTSSFLRQMSGYQELLERIRRSKGSGGA
jgi:hypothetical protein